MEHRRYGQLLREAWPVIVKDNINEQGAGGVHLDDNKQPYALVQAEDFWQLATSHETLEMLADPTGNRLETGTSPKKGEGRVQFLVEVCDPSEAAAYAYHVNGILVSDFYTPHYFDPGVTVGTRYSFTIRGTFDALRPGPPWRGQRMPKTDASAKATRRASVAIAESRERSIAELA